jgi:pimeloyl-ACP methyl ester carboxylesterase
VAKPTFVLVHGYWDNSHCWGHVEAGLDHKGFAARSLDLPGAGANAANPRSYSKRPLDHALFAAEPSPNASVTQKDRTAAVVKLIDAIDGPVILVGHSMGGATISDVAETIPHRLAAAIYVTAFLLPPGTPPIAVIQHETMAAALVPSLILADPAAVGALGLDPRSEDEDYRRRLKAAFYGDVEEAEAARAILALHCDEPLATTVRPSAVTRGRYGSVARHYVRCTEDRAITPAGQDYMIAHMDEARGGSTAVSTLPCSHSPFLSRPGELTEILVRVADA